MATITTPAKALPNPGDLMDAEPVRDYINNIVSFLHSTNIDEANVDLSGADGIVGKSTAQTITGVKTFQTTANAAGAVQRVVVYEWDPGDGGNMTDGSSGVGLSFKMPDSADSQQEFGRIDILCVDDLASSKDSDISFKTMIDDTLTEVFKIGSSGLTLTDINITDNNKIYIGSAPDYWLTYTSSNTAFEFKSTNADGSNGDGIVFDVQDGTNDVRFVGGISTDNATAPTAGLATSVLTASTITASGIVKTDNATEATTTTDGSLQTDGGLSVVKDAVFGDDVKLLSDSAVLSLGAGNDATLTHDGTTGVTIAANPITITSATAATWSTSAGALTLNGTGGVNIQEGGSTIIGISDARVLATTNTASVDLDATGAIQVNSSGGAISIANDNVDQNVNLATAGTRTLAIGILDGTDTTTITSKGNQTHSGTITVGVDDTGYDVKLFGATSGQYLLWDESSDELVLAGDTKLSFHDAAGGENIIASSNGHLEVNAGTTLDVTAPTIELHHSSELRQTGPLHTFFRAANDGNPEYKFGASAAECLRVQPVFDSGAQTLNYVIFETLAASGTANKGEIRFQVDATSASLVKIQDSGVTIAGTLTTGAGLTATTITASGVLKTDDATEATSTTDGSLQTDGGLSVVKDAVFGDDIKLLSDSAVLSLGEGSDATLTHDGTTGVTIAANPVTITSAGAATWSTSSGALSLTSAAALNITPASGSAIVLDGTINVDAGVITGATSITSTALAASTITGSGVLSVDDATDSTSGTTGSVHTDGGLGVAKNVYISEELHLLDSKNIKFGTGEDATIQYDGTNLVITPDVVGSGYISLFGDTLVGIGHELVIGHTSALTTVGAEPHLQIFGNNADSGASRVVIGRFDTGNAAPRLEFLKSDTTTIGANALVNDNDIVMQITAQVADGGDFISDIGQLTFEVDDGTPAANQTGGAFVISTTGVTASTAVERMRIDSSGNVGIGIASSLTAKVSVSGDIDMVATGNRIDFDTDNDASIRASADDVLTIELGGADQMAFSNKGVYSGSAGPSLALHAGDMGNNNMGQVVAIGRNTNGTNSAAGMLVMEDKSGTAHYIWVEDSGELRISSAHPYGTTDASAGVRVGTQS